MAILKFDGGFLNYTLVRRKGMKNIRIRIKTDGSIVVSADTSVVLCEIETLMLQKLEWIFQNSKKISQKYTEEIQESALVSGAKLRIFGNEYKLIILLDEFEKCFINNENLIIKSQNPDNEAAIEISLLRFIAETGREKSEKYILFYLKKCGYSGKTLSLSMKMLKSKWGHFNPRNNEIMLNYALAGLPECFLEYLVAHEVTHLYIRNHSPEFYAFGEKLLPGFKKLDRELNKFKTDLWRNIIIKE